MCHIKDFLANLHEEKHPDDAEADEDGEDHDDPPDGDEVPADGHDEWHVAERPNHQHSSALDKEN